MASEAFTGEIRHFSFGFAPKKWAQCNGQVLQISQNQALFKVIGTNYGGDGTTTFALPNLQGTVPISAGAMTNGPTYAFGATGGAATVPLSVGQLPIHTHSVSGSNTGATTGVPSSSVLPGSYGTPTAYANSSSLATMNAQTIGNNGGGAAHENRQPFLVLNVCICLSGIFPTRN